MRKILVVVVLLASMVGTAGAAEVNCCTCPEVRVTCECACDQGITLPGFYRGVIYSPEGVPIFRCGVVTVIGSGFILDQGEGRKDFFVINKLKKFVYVEECP